MPEITLPVYGTPPNEYSTRQALETLLETQFVHPGAAVSVLTETAAAKILTASERDLIGSIRSVPGLADLVPVVVSGDLVLIWAGPDGLYAPGLARVDDVPNVIPVAQTDGAALHRWRTALARVRAGVPGAKARLALIGDSWCEMPAVARAARAALSAGIGLAGEGWRSPFPGNALEPTSRSASGWTLTDGSTTSTFPNGAGPDGNLSTTTGTTATMQWSNLIATDIRILHFAHGGTWRWRIDGGAWTTVTAGTTGAAQFVHISSLSDTAHTLEIDTAGNAGIVAIGGLHATRAAEPGAEVLRWGNGGSTGNRARSYAGYLTGPAAVLQPDLAVIILGTNDFRVSGSPPSIYVEGLQAIADALRASVPDIGILVVVPPQSDAAAVTPLPEYRDAARAWATANGADYFSALDRWPAFAMANAHGLWADNAHLTDLGASVLWADLADKLIGG